MKSARFRSVAVSTITLGWVTSLEVGRLDAQQLARRVGARPPNSAQMALDEGFASGKEHRDLAPY